MGKVSQSSLSFTQGAVSLAALTDHENIRRDMNYVPPRQRRKGMKQGLL